ncbi:hypothetical protein EUGRSUZ_J00358 [Eucalyptus grandis]|uniref:Uncharacterized protein n=2 Tax=Eucalyptus grandis TaxID=71139 RepID=A0A059AA01_EUCGR|nr:hypothetical protein EUGRSUZ_J00358 [Eucalyptus grandis]
MGVSMKQTAVIVGTLGTLSFIFGVIAENKKPASGTVITGKDVVICKFPSDPTVALGYLSFAFLLLCTVAGYWSLFYPYKGRFVGGLAAAMLLWPTITEQLHQVRNVHKNLSYECPTAKTGLLGGGAFLSLDSALFWLVALMLADNTREDFFDEVDEPRKDGDQGEALTSEYEVDGHIKGVA